MVSVSERKSNKYLPEFKACSTEINIAFAFILFCTAIAVYVPLSPYMPGVGLDPSWQFGMNEATAKGMVFGEDVIFTFGPYASIYTQQYHPGTDHLMLLGSTYLATLFFFLLFLNFAKAGLPLKVILIIVLAGIVVARDSLFFFYPLLLGVLSCRWTQEPDNNSRSETFKVLSLFVFFTPLGFLPLIKGTALFACLGIAFLSIVVFALGKKWLYLIAVICAPTVSMILFWSVAGQPLSGLPSYFLNLLPIVSGYTEAMALDGNPQEILIYLLTSMGLLAVLFANLHGGYLYRATLSLMFFGVLLLGFKAGFVRHAGHEVIAATTLLLAALLAATLTSTRAAILVVFFAFASWVYIDANPINTNFNRVKSNLKATYLDAYSGLRQRIASPQDLIGKFDDRISEIKAGSNIHQLSGSVDIYSYEQSYLIASGNDWKPRPVLQSYSAYTSSLALKNRDYLLGSMRPDHIIFKVQPIDNRLPALEDGASWPALLSNYDLTSMQYGSLYLEARTVTEPSAEARETRVFYGNLNEPIQLPGTDDILFVEVNLKKSFIGKIVNTLFKISQPRIQVTLHNDAVRNYRLVSAMAEAGFIISPLVESTEEMGLLLAGASQILRKNVRSFEISAAYSAYLWQNEFEVKLSTIDYRPQSEVLDNSFFAKPVEMSFGISDPTDRCEGSIDSFNGNIFPDEVMQVSSFFKIDGWFVASIDEADVPERVFLVLDSVDNERFYIETERSQRPDVVAHFNRPGLQSAGFSAVADVSGLDGAFDLRLAYMLGDDIVLCPKMSLELMIAAGRNNE